MTIMPIDLRKQEFRRRFRGCDPDEVKAFLTQAADELDDCLRRNENQSVLIKSLEEKVEGYAKIERTLNETLITAQKVGDESRVNAQREAELIVKEAAVRATELENESRRRIAALESELASLKNLRDSFLARFKGLLTTQLSLVDVISGEVEDDDGEREPPTTSEFFAGELPGAEVTEGNLPNGNPLPEPPPEPEP